LLLSLPIFSYKYLKSNFEKMNEDQFTISFGTLYTNVKTSQFTAYTTTTLFCARRMLVAFGTIYLGMTNLPNIYILVFTCFY